MIRNERMVNWAMQLRIRPLEGITFGFIALVYVLTQSPHPGFGDGLGFLYYAVKGFDWATNATSHFLYTNFNHLVLKLLPFLPPERVLVMLSSLFALGSLGFLYRISLHLKATRIGALLGVLVMGLSFSWWRQAVTIEVYAMNGFFVLAMIEAWLRTRGQTKKAWQVGLWYGLSLLVHIQNILFLPFFLYHLWEQRNQAAWLSFAIALGLFSILFIPPILLETNAFAAIFVDRQFGGAVWEMSLSSLGRGFVRSLAYLVYNFHVFLPLLLWGLVRWCRENGRLAWVVGGSGAIFWGFAMRYDVTDNYVFFLFPYFMLVAAGQGGLLAWPNWKPIYKALLAALLPFVIYAGTVWSLNQIPQAVAWAEPKTYKGGIRYYVWPGRSQAPDPVQLAAEIQAGERDSIPDFDRLPVALRYLEFMAAPDPQ